MVAATPSQHKGLLDQCLDRTFVVCQSGSGDSERLKSLETFTHTQVPSDTSASNFTQEVS